MDADTHPQQSSRVATDAEEVLPPGAGILELELELDFPWSRDVDEPRSGVAEAVQRSLRHVPAGSRGRGGSGLDALSNGEL
jgi:hypothetical protein